MRRLVLLLALVAGCKSSGPANAVDLTIVADGSVTPAMLATVSNLVIAVSGVHQNTKSYPLSGLPKQETVQLLPTVSSGMLTIDVSATDGAMNVVAEGNTTVMLTGKLVPATVTLSLSTPAPVVVTPSTATVTRGHTQQFSAGVPVTWSVTGGNGTIDANGLYTAPMAEGGPFTVVATSVADTSVSGNAAVTVVDYGVELLAGALGGPGVAEGTGTSARINAPSGIVSDGNGFLYVSEALTGGGFGCTIRKVDVHATNGIPTVTLWGGVPGQCVDVDGTMGVDARFAFIRALALDPAAGVLWVVEITNIRKIVLATGVVTTLAVGTPAGPLSFSGFSGLAVDSANNTLYISSQGQHTIHKVTLSGAGADTLFAGTPGTPGSADAPSGPATMASFHSPQHLAYDGTNLWVADRDNATLRKIVVATGAVTTAAGVAGMPGSTDGVGSAARLTSPFGLSFGNTTGTLYVSDIYDGLVRVFTVGSGQLSTLAGVAHASALTTPGIYPATDNTTALQATFGQVRDVAYDPYTVNVYAIEFDNSVLRAIGLNATNPVMTVAGTQPHFGNKDDAGPSARFWGLGAVASDGKVAYLADNGNATIRSYDFATGLVATVAGQAGKLGSDDGPALQAKFNRPEGLFLDGTNLYISDGGGSTIRKLDLQAKSVSTIAGQYQVQGSADGIGTAATFSEPIYLTGDGADHLFVADNNVPILRRLTISTGEVKTIAGSASSNVGFMDGTGAAATFASPYGIAYDGGVLYVCDSLFGIGAGVRTVDLTSFQVKTVAGGTTTDMIVDGVGTAAKLSICLGMASDGHGHVYFGDAGVLRMLDVKSGMVTKVVGSPFTEVEQPGPLATATINAVNGLAVLPSGDLLLADTHESSLFEVRVP